MSFFTELKRRNVLRVAAGYVVVAWLAIQVASEVLPPFGVGDNIIRLIIIGFAVGFILVVLLAWIFEWTPEGIRKDSEVDRGRVAITTSAKRWDRIVTAILALAVVFFVVENILESTDEIEPTLAILPFSSIGSDPEQAYLGAGLAGEMLTLLADIPALKVIAQESSMLIASKDLSIRDMAEELNVRHILTGSVQTSGDRIRVTAHLVDAQSETYLWSDTLDGSLDDIFDMQDRISARIVDKLHIELVGPMPTALRTDPAVLALTLRAKQIFYETVATGTEAGGERMAQLLEQALDIDPDYTPAMAWSSYAEWASWQEGLIDEEEFSRRFDEWAERALAIDPEQAMFLHQMALKEIVKNGNPEAAAPLYQRALRSGPRNSEVLRHVGRFAFMVERFDESHALLERAVELDPLCTMCHYFLSLSYMYAGRLEDAEQVRMRYIALTGVGHFYLGLIRLLMGQAESALDIFQDEDKVQAVYGLKGRAMALHDLGRRTESDEVLEVLTREFGNEDPDMVAEVYAWRNEKDAAFDWLSKVPYGQAGSSSPNSSRMTLVLHPEFRNLHDDPRWDEFRRRVGFPKERLEAIDIDLSLPE